MQVKRFIIFRLNSLYPHTNGGWNDFLGSFATEDEARKYVSWEPTISGNTKDQWAYQIVDLETGEKVYDSYDP